MFSNKQSSSSNHRSFLNNNNKDNIHTEKFSFQETFNFKANSVNKCFKKPDSNIISKCSDHTMLRIDFQDCINLESSSSSSSIEFKTRKMDSNIKKELSWTSQRLLSNKANLNEQEEDGIVAQCIAHWTEGNLNYLIVKKRIKFITTIEASNVLCTKIWIDRLRTRIITIIS